MSSYDVGGYIFFSTLPDRQTLIDLVLNAMELTREDELNIWLPNEEDHDLSTLPAKQALQKLVLSADGGFDVRKAPDRSEAYWFDQPIGPYQSVRVTCSENELDGNLIPGGGDRMAQRWLKLCEEGKAEFGLFGQFEQMIEIEYRDAQLLPLEQKDVRKLMAEWPAYWLTYLGPELAERWRALQLPLQAYETLWLPSGAFYARAHPNLHS